jgi:hypothetical protein
MSEIFPARNMAIEVISCTDPAREGEFNWWYDRVQIPYYRTIPGIVDAYRYRDMQPNLGDLGAHFMTPAGMANRYLTIYRINSEDPWGLMQKVKEEDQKRAAAGKTLDCLKSYELTVWDLVAFRRTIAPLPRPETHLPDGMPEAIFLVYAIGDPPRRLEHDEWWLYAHAHDLLETPGMVQAHRHRSLKPNLGEKEAANLHLYEVDSDDPVAVLKRILEDDRDIRKPQGRFIKSGKGGRAECYGRGIYRHWDLM